MNRLLDQIKKFEGYSSRPYWDHKQWSVGYGTRASGPNDRVNRSQALQRLQARIQRDIDAVNYFAPNAPQGTKNALISLSYNVGTGWMNKGLGRFVKAGNWDKARNRFLQYNKASGKTNQTLARRRATESSWFGIGEKPSNISTAPRPQPLQSNPQARVDHANRMSVPIPQNLQQGMTQAGQALGAGLQKGGQMARLRQAVGLTSKPAPNMSVAPPAPMSTRPELVNSNQHSANPLLPVPADRPVVQPRTRTTAGHGDLLKKLIAKRQKNWPPGFHFGNNGWFVNWRNGERTNF